MRIFMVSSDWLNGKDARAIQVLELFRSLSRISDVFLFIFASKGLRRYIESKMDYSNHIVFVPSGSSILGRLIGQLLLFFYMVYHYRKFRPNILFAINSITNFSPPLVSSLLGIPYVVHVNGPMIKEIKMLKIPGIIKRIAIIASIINEKLNYKVAKKITVVASGVGEEIKKLYRIVGKEIFLLEDAANTELFRPMNREETRRELNLDADVNLVCHIGNLAPWQGVEYLVQSAPLILKEEPNTKFLIVGDGVMREELIDLARRLNVLDRFIFTGWVPYEEVPKYINASDVCIVYTKPKLGERSCGCSPHKLYEYLSCGKPVVASKLREYEVLEKEGAGILVEPENPEELARAVVELLRDRKLQEELGRNGREFVLREHSWEAAAKKVANVCYRALKEHKA